MYNDFGTRKEVQFLSGKKKLGRPTDSLKSHDLKVRVNDEMYKIITDYCKKYTKNKAEAIRDGIYKLKDSLDK